MPEINWDLAWTIACGVVIGGFLLNALLSILSLLGNMWEDNWKVTTLIVLCYTIFPATILGAFLEYLGWIWLIPSFIAGYACHHVAENILVKEEGGDLEIY
jgi:hypothetical protein